MEPTKAQLVAARRAARDDVVPALSVDPAVIDAAVRAAFAAVPDPIVWAQKTRERAKNYSSLEARLEAKMLADDLVSFMRGDNK